MEKPSSEQIRLLFSQLWFPNSSCLMGEIEGLQITFTSKITSVNSLKYWESMKALHLYYLECQSERYTIIYV